MLSRFYCQERSLAWGSAGVCLRVYDRACRCVVSVCITSVLTFNVSHLFALAIPGRPWKGAYQLNFHRRQSW